MDTKYSAHEREMSKEEMQARVSRHRGASLAAIKKIEDALFDLLNSSETRPLTFMQAITEWHAVRQYINNENVVIILNVLGFAQVCVPLTGDLVKDVGQYNENDPGN